MRNLKKSVISTVLLVFIGFSLSAQNKSSFGFKGGLNYGANGDYFDSVNLNYSNPDQNIGYHIGIFGKIGNKIYLRPEIVYTVTKSDYDNNDFNVKKIDVPVLVGVKVLGPLILGSSGVEDDLLIVELKFVNLPTTPSLECASCVKFAP